MIRYFKRAIERGWVYYKVDYSTNKVFISYPDARYFDYTGTIESFELWKTTKEGLKTEVIGNDDDFILDQI